VEKLSTNRTWSRNTRRPAVIAWLHLLRIVRRTERAAAEELRRWDLSYAQFDVIAQLGAAEGITQQELARNLLVTQGNITQLLDKLEARGLVRRCPVGRTNQLVLTDAGRELWAAVVPAHEDWQAARFAGLTREEQRELMLLLGKLERAQREA
jgi:DNA-binding MarR family transcriptional regulator